MLENNEDWIACAAEALAGGAAITAGTIRPAPRQKIGKANGAKKPRSTSPSHPDSVEPTLVRTPSVERSTETKQGQATVHTSAEQPSPDPTKLPGQLNYETHSRFAGQTPSGGHHPTDAQGKSAPGTQQIVEEWLRRMDMLRARQRLELQAQAICRRFVDGDKTKAAKLWAEVRKDDSHELRIWLAPFLAAIAPLDAAKSDIEKTLTKLVKQQPIHEWAKGISGLGEVSLAGIIGESGIGPGEYRTVSALWKRMGLAVIGGGRQRRVTGSEGIEHGYNAERRSHMWNIGGCIMKAQLRSQKDEAGKKIEGSEYSLGELGEVYLNRKAYLRERDPERSAAHIHNDAKRYMEKRLLRQLWQQWRQAKLAPEPSETVPAAEPLTESRKAAQ